MLSRTFIFVAACLVVLGVLSFSAIGTALAENETAFVEGSQSSICGKIEKIEQLKIMDVEVKNNGGEGLDENGLKNISINSTVSIAVDCLAEYLEGREADKFVLYLDSRPIKGLTSRAVDGNKKIQFDVVRTEESKEEWNKLMSRPPLSLKNDIQTKVNLSIGYDAEGPVYPEIAVNLIIMTMTKFYLFIGFFGFIFLFFIGLANKTNIIRDVNWNIGTNEKAPVSLGKTQMAVWFFVVAASFVFIWMVTEDLNSLPESALVLVGISAATGLGSVAISDTKGRTSKSPPEAKKLPFWPHWSDGIIRDDNGDISLPRFQIAGWTVILIVIFIINIYENLAMPQFSSTLLTVMGISSGTYLGFKHQEKP